MTNRSAVNLYLTDLKRAYKDKSLWIIFLIFAGLSVLLLLVFAGLRFSIDAPFADPSLGFFTELALMIPIGALFPIMMVVMLSIFTTKDFGYRTIRNKIIAGNSRLKIYLSALFVNLTIFAALYLVFAIVLVPLTGLVFTFYTMGDLVLRILLAFPVFIAKISLVTFICLGLRQRVGGIVVNLVVMLYLPTVLMIFAMIIAAGVGPGFNVTAWTYFMTANPFSLITRILFPLMDMSATLPLLSYNYTYLPSINYAVMVPIVSVVFAGASTGFGILSFSRAEIK